MQFCQSIEVWNELGGTVTRAWQVRVDWYLIGCDAIREIFDCEDGFEFGLVEVRFLDVLLEFLGEMSLEEVGVPSQQLRKSLIQGPAFILSLQLRPIFLYLQAFPALLGGLGMHRATLDGRNMGQFAEDWFSYRVEFLLASHAGFKTHLLCVVLAVLSRPWPISHVYNLYKSTL